MTSIERTRIMESLKEQKESILKEIKNNNKDIKRLRQRKKDLDARRLGIETNMLKLEDFKGEQDD